MKKRVLMLSLLLASFPWSAKAENKKYGPDVYASVYTGAFMAEKNCSGIRLNRRYFTVWSSMEDFSQNEQLKVNELISVWEDKIQFMISVVGAKKWCKDNMVSFRKFFPGPEKPVAWE